MTEAVMDRKTETSCGAGNVERFVNAVENDDSLELLGTSEIQGKEVFVLRNIDLPDGIEGRYLEISVAEVIKIATTSSRAKQFVDAAVGRRNDIEVKGYTRIVGYYSGVRNWNKSKIGELRDRSKGQYGTGNFQEKNKEDRMSYINNH